jgi:hypothetical protein
MLTRRTILLGAPLAVAGCDINAEANVLRAVAAKIDAIVVGSATAVASVAQWIVANGGPYIQAAANILIGLDSLAQDALALGAVPPVALPEVAILHTLASSSLIQQASVGNPPVNPLSLANSIVAEAVTIRSQVRTLTASAAAAKKAA